MRIEIIKQFDPMDATEGWRLSRDIANVPLFSDICNIDAPVMELPSFLLHFQDFMILEREIFASQRNHVIWARTSRVDDPLEFKVPAETEPLIDSSPIKQRMLDRKTAGEHQDQWRSELPLAALTSWVERISYRDVQKFAGYFTYLTEKVRQPALRQRFFEIAIQLFDLAPFEKFGAPVKFLHEGNEFFTGLHSAGQFQLIGIDAPIALRAQAVRHRPIAFVDNFFQLITSPNVFNCNIGTSVKMELSASIDFWNSIAKKRSCWIAQYDLWRPVIELLAKDSSVLPCANGTCPFNADAMLRVEGKDPAPPCPIHLELNSIDKEPWRKAMSDYAHDRPDFWQERIAR